MRLLVCVLPFVSKLASASAPPPAIQNGLSRTAPALLRHTRFYASTTTSLTAFPGAIRPMSATTNGTNAKTVMQPATLCLLCCSGEQRHEPIQLPATELFHLGRTAETQIKDVFCARRQVSIAVNLAKRNVTIQQLGINASGLNGFALEANVSHIVQPGDIIEVLHGKYMYEVRFESPEAAAADVPAADVASAEVAAANCTIEEPTSLKRTRSSEKQSIAKQRRVEAAAVATPLPPDVDVDGEIATADTWEKRSNGQLLVFTARGVRPADHIAAYDLDGTIIRTKSGNVFPKSADDWQIAFDAVPAMLQRHWRNGHKIVFFTNQAGLTTGRTNEADWKRKVEAIVRRLSVPVQVFAATGSTIYRKPRTGMWDTMREQLNGGRRVVRANSWFVGDAAGRPAVGSRRKDHSLADRLFALNVKVPFQTPEEHFVGAAVERFAGPEFEPQEAMRVTVDVFRPREAAQSVAVAATTTAKRLQVIVMVGGPGSGKSFVARQRLEPNGFVVINQDALKTWQKCAAMLEATLKSKRCAVIDNTNVDKEARQRYIAIAAKLGARCRCFVMITSLAQCRHNIAFRELLDPKRSKIPERLLLAMKNKYQVPQLEEGFEDIVHVNCVPQFTDKLHESMYGAYLVEK